LGYRSAIVFSKRSKIYWIAALFLLPNLAGFLVFTLAPVLLSLWMAFTNWSLKPAVKLEFLGLRNFTDLLGVRALQASHPGLLAAYLACALGLTAGMVGALWAKVAGWKGTRPADLLLLLGGLACFALGLTLGGQGVVFSGLVAAVLGGVGLALQEEGWAAGWGTVPVLLLGLSSLGLWALNASMWSAYEPRDLRFWEYFYNTLFLMLGTPASILGSLGLALLLNQELPENRLKARLAGAGLCLFLGILSALILAGLGYPNAGLLAGLVWLMASLGLAFNVVAFRTIFYLPSFSAGVALMILWKAIYNPDTGPLNTGLAAFFHVFGWNPELPKWLSSVAWAKPSLILMGEWTSVGGMNMLLYLAGLANVSPELVDAAKVDGAGGWQRFRHVLWPQLLPTTFFISIMAVIGGLQAGFDQARVMTAGGPAGSTTTLAYYIYNLAFQDLNLGYAAAISWVLFGIIFVATALNWKFGKDLEV
jgi:multiple sugar transport system permease protein